MYKKSLGKFAKNALCAGLAAVMVCGCAEAKNGDAAVTAESEAAAVDASVEASADAAAEATTEADADSTVVAAESAEEADMSEEIEPEGSVADDWTRIPQETCYNALQHYEGFIDECEGYIWKDEFKNCDYDGDGQVDRVQRRWQSTAHTAEYVIHFGIGSKLTLPECDETGFPHIQGADLDGDRSNELLVSVTYNNWQGPREGSDMWLYSYSTSGRYEEVTLPLELDKDGEKGLTFNYDKPEQGSVHFASKDGKQEGTVVLGEGYIKANVTNAATSDLRCVYRAQIHDGSDPFIRCYISPFPYCGSSFYFDLKYSASEGNYVASGLTKTPSDEDVIPVFTPDEQLAGTFCLNENGQVKVMFGESVDVPESGNVIIEHHEGEEERVYELTDDPFIYLYYPLDDLYGERCPKDLFMEFLQEGYQIDCVFHVNEAGKVDYMCGWYVA